MPDSFFASAKSRKRKRTDASARGGHFGNAKTTARTGDRQSKKTRVTAVNGAKKRAVDEELSDESDEGFVGLDDADLRGGGADDDADASGDEDEDETPAQKRLRLAKLYLESVKEGLGESSSFFHLYIYLTVWQQRKENLTRLRLIGNLFPLG